MRFFIGFIVLLTACASKDGFQEDENEAYVDDVLSYNRTPLPNPPPKIFLVAGGYDNANFGQEVIDQKLYWNSRGYSDEDIVCYYVRPLHDTYVADLEQY